MLFPDPRPFSACGPLFLPPPRGKTGPGRGKVALEGPLPEGQALRLVGSLPCPQTSPVGSHLAGREMGLGEGVGWQGEGTGWQRKGAEGPQLVILCLSTKVVHIHIDLFCGGGEAGMPLPGGQ